jgi:hypothetical protein
MLVSSSVVKIGDGIVAVGFSFGEGSGVYKSCTMEAFSFG